MTTFVLVATLLAVLVFVLLSGCYSGAETGVYVVNRIRLRLRADAGQPDARRFQHLIDDPRGLITTTLVGTNVAVFATSALVTRLFEARLANPQHAAYLATVILSPFLFIFAELVPKNLFRRHADPLVYRFSRFLQISSILFRPVVVVLKRITSIWDLLLGERPQASDPLRSRERLLSLLMTGAEEGILTPYQHDVAGNILRVASVPVERAMIPIDRVVTVDAPAAPERVLKVLSEAGHSRYPVRSADGSIAQVLDVTDYLLAWRAGRPTEEALRPPTRLPVGTSVPVALERLQAARPPVGLVVDQDDRPRGFVTIKDLVEEIVGELGDW